MADDVSDIRSLVADIERTVAARRARGEYPAALLERLHEEFTLAPAEQPAEVLCVVESARPIPAGGPVTGAVLRFAKRVVRRTLAWYVAPIARDQTAFNIAVLRDVRRLEARVATLEAALERRDDAQPPHATS